MNVHQNLSLHVPYNQNLVVFQKTMESKTQDSIVDLSLIFIYYCINKCGNQGISQNTLAILLSSPPMAATAAS